ncbi:hypothetical protein SCRM01_100c [Synechococcus phage S-CRM01]|uniref:hypothetical protein n=1 Tax=Synechococcus phage S-CRM01 TaxID=1026955 RepID=UPI000209E3A0|nr:hypothetical protein SCRM01_100c [Synechococcus phage S-CRM01]AEC53046.1 hypothetical protein SCRM01_100c [Synechococcus phage S-CRM01]
MSKRAERVYLAFFEGEGGNAPRLARTIRQAIAETLNGDEPAAVFDFIEEIEELCNELDDPNLLDGIYGNCYD